MYQLIEVLNIKKTNLKEIISKESITVLVWNNQLENLIYSDTINIINILKK